MSQTGTSPTSIDQAISDTFPHLRDVSIRDGVQSWDANKWYIADILPVAKALNSLAVVASEYGSSMAPVEAWGGGQVGSPAKFLGEDTFENLKAIHAAAPKLKLQALYRGRQAYGYVPVSEEVQRAALAASVESGLRVIRPFDMMNDMTNLMPGLTALRELKAQYPDLVVEGAISYISEPEGRRAWELADYGELAVKMVRAGADEIAIKNYAGVGDHEMPDLIRAIRAKLDEAGFTTTKINLHDHGTKPDVLATAVEAGADKVDVAFGDLSDGPSHSNAINTLKALLAKKGFDTDGKDKEVFEANPIVQQMREVERVVAVHAEKYKSKRGNPLSQEQMDKYRIAGGAMADLEQNYIKSQKDFESWQKIWAKARGNSKLQPDEFGAPPPIPQTKQEWRDQVLELATQLWEKGGRFNTVTPGALYLLKQAMQIHTVRLSGRPVSMADYTNEYMDIVTGRFGENKGMEKGIGDTKFRDAVLMYRALGKLESAVKNKQIAPTTAAAFTMAASLGEPSMRPAVASGTHLIDLKHPNLQNVLKGSNIDTFKKAVETTAMPPELKEVINRELTIGKSADPTKGLETGRELVAKVANKVSEIREKGTPISDDERLALLAMLLRKKNNFGMDDDSAFYMMVESLRSGKSPDQLALNDWQVGPHTDFIERGRLNIDVGGAKAATP